MILRPAPFYKWSARTQMRHFTRTDHKCNMSKCPIVNDVDFAAMAHSDPKKTMGGAGVAIVYSRKSKSDRDDVVFQLVKPDPALLTDKTSQKDRDMHLQDLPSIRTGFHLQAEPKYEVNGKHLIHLAITEEQAEQMRRLDEANIAEVVTNASKWFKRSNLPPELVRAQHSTVVSRYPTTSEVEEDSKTTTLRVKVYEGKTEILVQNAENYLKFHRGDIKDLTRNARVIPVLQDMGIYFRATESGGQLMVKRILVMHGSCSGETAEFDLGGMDIEIEEDFVPPQEQTYAGKTIAAAPPTMAPDTEYATEQTVVGAPPPQWGGNTDNGPAVVF